MADPRSFRRGLYVIDRPIGEGGMAKMYLGRHTTLKKPVAIKVLSPRLLEQDRTFVNRFELEAIGASSINSPNVVQVFDYGPENGFYFIVMEYIDGVDVKEALRESGPLPPEVALSIVAEIASGLRAAHERGLVHRDVKPSNVLIGRDGAVKVADFGLVRDVSGGDEGLTLPGVRLGTVPYMSPEQAAGLPVDAQTDIFSLGIVAFELLTGRRPFDRANPADTLAAIQTAEAPSLGSLVPVDPQIEALVDRMLEKSASRRYPSMRHVVAAAADGLEAASAPELMRAVRDRREFLRGFAESPGEFVADLKARRAEQLRNEARPRGDQDEDVDSVQAGSASVPAKLPEGAGAAVPVLLEAPAAKRETLVLPAVPEVVDGATILVASAPSTSASPSRRITKWLTAVVALAAAVVGVVAKGADLASKLWPPRPEQVVVVTEPPGAELMVRQDTLASFHAVGFSPSPFEVPPGWWQVRASVPSIGRVTQWLEVKRKQTLKREWNIAKMCDQGELRITSEPTAARVSMRHAGQESLVAVDRVTPLSFRLPAGSYEVVCRSECFLAETLSVNVEPGRPGVLAYHLKPEREFYQLRLNPLSTNRIDLDGVAIDAPTGQVTVSLTFGDVHRVSSPAFPGGVRFTVSCRDAKRRLTIDFARGRSY